MTNKKLHRELATLANPTKWFNLCIGTTVGLLLSWALLWLDLQDLSILPLLAAMYFVVAVLLKLVWGAETEDGKGDLPKQMEKYRGRH